MYPTPPAPCEAMCLTRCDFEQTQAHCLHNLMINQCTKFVDHTPVPTCSRLLPSLPRVMAMETTPWHWGPSNMPGSKPGCGFLKRA